MMHRMSPTASILLVIGNILIVIFSIILLACGAIFMEFYHLDKLANWSYNCMVVPFYTIVLGTFTLFLGILGLLLNFHDNDFEHVWIRRIFALLLTVAIIAQIGMLAFLRTSLISKLFMK